MTCKWIRWIKNLFVIDWSGRLTDDPLYVDDEPNWPQNTNPRSQ